MESPNIFLFLGGLGGTEVVLILLAILLLFGAKRIPELAKGLGRGIREFKDATNEMKSEFETSAKPDEKKAPVEPRVADIKTERVNSSVHRAPVEKA